MSPLPADPTVRFSHPEHASTPVDRRDDCDWAIRTDQYRRNR